MAASEIVSCRDVFVVGKAGRGIFKANSTHFGWQCTESSLGQAQVKFEGAAIAAAEWKRSCGKGRCLLKLQLKEGAQRVVSFSGFSPEDMLKTKAHLERNFKIGVKEQPVATEGWSWGDVSSAPVSQDMRILVNGKLSFDVPVSNLKQVSTVGKSELNLEFAEESAVHATDEVLAEIRFFVPPGSNTDADELRASLQKRSGVSAGEALAHFSDVVMHAPRGKHDFEFFDSIVKVHGKTQTYTIPYCTVQRLFLLESNVSEGNSCKTFIIGLSKPLRQGTQLHHYLNLSFDNKTVECNLPEAYASMLKLANGTQVPLFSLLGRLLKELSGKTVASPSSLFKDLHPNSEFSIKCSYKAGPGLLFFCKQSMIFINKPVLWHRYEEIEVVHIDSGLQRGRTFDIQFIFKSTDDKASRLEFTQIDTGVLRATLEFLRQSQVNIANLRELQERAAQLAPSKSSKGGREARTAARASQAKAKEAIMEAEDDTDEEDEDFDEGDAKADDESESDDEDDDGAPVEEDEQPARKSRRR